MSLCFHCRATLPFTSKTARRDDVCPSCGRDVRVCLNCAFYDEAAHTKCREPQAEWVVTKDRANMCEYFTIGDGPVRTPTEISVQEAREKLNALFRPKTADESVD